MTENLDHDDQVTDDLQETDATDPGTDTDRTPEGTENVDTPDTQDEAEDTRKKGSHEAAKYRRQLRDTEAERDQLAAALGTARNIILNNHLQAQQISLKAAGIQRLGYDITQLVNDDLSINETALTSTLQDIEDNGFTYKTHQGIVRKSGTGSDQIEDDSPSWGDAIKGNHN